MLAEKRNEGTVGAPNDVLDGRGGDFREGLLLLDVVQDYGGRRTEDKARSTAVEYLVRLYRRFDALENRVGQVANFDQLNGPLSRLGFLKDRKIRTCVALLSTANLFLATKIAA